ncbi:MAG TPA: alpha/beta hydrolase [Chitinophagaceae bacterium]|nr:alpha/beta hydrolase [Chitinophagaceae bacterium]
MDKTITYQGRSLYYRVTGEGTPVVFVHGLAEDGEVWQEQVRFLENRYRLIVPDLPGSGRSESMDDLSMEALAASVRAILEAENIKEAIMIGHSMGGYVTLAFAEKYHGSLRAFGLFHSSAFADSDEKKASRKKNIEFIKTHGTHEYLKQSFAVLFSEESKKSQPGILEKLTQQYKDFNPASLSAYNEAMMQRPERTAILETFVNPVLFIIGKHDTAIPFEDSLKQCHLPALSYIHIFDKSGHMAMFEETQKVNEVLQNFLQDVS